MQHSANFDGAVEKIMTGIFGEKMKHHCKYATEGCSCSKCGECKVNQKDGKTLIYGK